MNRLLTLVVVTLMLCTTANAQDDVKIGRQNVTITDGRMTPEALWAMGRISSYAASPDGQRMVYQVGYYSVKHNKSRHVLYVAPLASPQGGSVLLTQGSKSETDPVWLDNETIAFMTGGEIWTMKADGTDRRQLSQTDGQVEGFKFSPDRKKVIIIKSIPFHDIIKENPEDLPKATGRVVTDLMYRHWDHYVESIQHPFVGDVEISNLKSQISNLKDILDGEPYECPMEPFGGIEQLDWSVDSEHIAYTCRKKTGLAYSISTDSDIYLYNIRTRETVNLCKQEGYVAPDVDPTKTLRQQAVNSEENVRNNMPGYDQNPKFSPDGRYVAWLSMARDGYESDRQRLCVFDLQRGLRFFVTEDFDSNVDDFCWSTDGNAWIYFIGVWHATENLYAVVQERGETRVESGERREERQETRVVQLTDDWADWGSLQMVADGGQLLMERHSYTSPADLYLVKPDTKQPAKTTVTQLTDENDHILSQLHKPTVRQHWVTTTDGKQMLVWVILPPDFDESKQYPTLLFCEGGPQSPVSQFWSYRWNFFIMASQGYVIVAPNRHGLPGFGSEWCEEISGDWTGQCMDDYLSAIDFATQHLPYVDRNRLGAVGASFGGFSVYYLAGHHNKRFKCFIAHDGAFNLEAMYTETEENWFSNWEYDDAYWNKDRTANADKTYRNSPHLSVDKWDTPILCIHGEKDYRINYTQGMSAFNAARMKGIEAELLIFPDENHWVLKPQNGILWQRTYFDWLGRWLR